jgi:plastocyanin domain-containing protein
MADLLNAQWIEMMEKMQTDNAQGNREKYIKYRWDSNSGPSGLGLMLIPLELYRLMP